MLLEEAEELVESRMEETGIAWRASELLRELAITHLLWRMP